MQISIIGLGLIGGSYALSLKKRLEDLIICGWDKNEKNLQKALEMGIIDKAGTSPMETIADADWIFLAIPVDAISVMIPSILSAIRENQVLVDFGSTKLKICETVINHPKRTRFIAAHPISGTEFSGPEYAFDTLFENKVMIVCDQEKSDMEVIARFRKQCKMLGMSTTYLTAEEHDAHIAYVSHLSHAISFSLSQTVLEKEESEDRILDMAGSGFASTVRLAKSSPEMWTPIFFDNRQQILEAMEDYIKQVLGLKKLLEDDDREGFYAFLKKCRAIRKIL